MHRFVLPCTAGPATSCMDAIFILVSGVFCLLCSVQLSKDSLKRTRNFSLKMGLGAKHALGGLGLADVLRVWGTPCKAQQAKVSVGCSCLLSANHAQH